MEALQKIQRSDFFTDLHNISQRTYSIYTRCILDYHVHDLPDMEISNPYPSGTTEHLFYRKCWIDTVQWHLEDEIRAREIEPGHALRIKHTIDSLNQARTDIVEVLDSLIAASFDNVNVFENARVNTESPAWALDRLSILALKIYHMEGETRRHDASEEHTKRCCQKLEVLSDQHRTLSVSINELFHDIAQGKKRMKVYRQMKMYNDLSLNPVLYNARK